MIPAKGMPTNATPAILPTMVIIGEVEINGDQSTASFSSRDGKCLEMAPFSQSAAEREEECEVESPDELSAFIGRGGR